MTTDGIGTAIQPALRLRHPRTRRRHGRYRSDRAEHPRLAGDGSGQPTAAVLVLHGGAQAGADRVRPWSHAYLRMVPFAASVHAAGRGHGIAVCQLRNRVRGWNAPQLDPVADARWALAAITRRYGSLPVVVIGHSMGGRVALRIADDEHVVAVAALAPWTTDKDWVSPVRDVRVLIAHGLDDTITSPAASLRYAERAADVADVVRCEIAGDGHAMLRRARTWTRLVRAFALDVVGVSPAPCAARADEPWLAAAACTRDRRLRVLL